MKKLKCYKCGSLDVAKTGFGHGVGMGGMPPITSRQYICNICKDIFYPTNYQRVKREFTGQYERSDRTKPIYIGDLVTLSIPRKSRLPELIVFKVIKDREDMAIIYHSGPMSIGDPNYKQKLNFQVYKVIGSIETDIDESLLE